MSDTKRRGHQPPALDELLEARTDFVDMPVEALGGKVLRLYALSGTARAKLMSAMVDLADLAEATEGRENDDLDPATVERVFMFQIRVVGASLGYPEDQWESIGALGDATIDELYEAGSKLSGLDKDAQDKAVQRLRPARNAASGTD